ncbi:formate dehydrogenase subunit gamma [Rhizobium wuzhouense]|uniref:Formate dehydrogenase subunit gamma n=1 Tax=Rhizobium wuzhouense TaxID=1986026 RepID=A0ABX5NRR1_9HYPH|nr:formate dehydrogenase subunit gamma [Rhizobium wuzhouense]PYB74008.1 formate dehydrogenase subunit gamma [Rhizobium wuzhouense]
MNIRVAADDQSARIAAIVAELRHLEGPMLPILHRVQQEFGFVPEAAKQVIANALNLSRAEVHGVITFYHDFRADPAGRHVLKLCRAEACQSMGCESLADKIKAKLGIDWHETTPDGAVTLEPVFCLGLCAQAPAAMLDGELHARLDEHCLSDILAEVRT